MKKIMFNDKYGLTDAVLQGRKTMTRRMCLGYDTGAIMTQDYKSVLYQPSYNRIQCYTGCGPIHYSKDAAYKIGEVVAVAQSYKSVFEESLNYALPRYHWLDDHIDEKGFANKMFVKAGEMPHQIKITDIKVERLQDISDEDCMCEGVTWDYDDYPTMSRKVYFINDYEAFLSPHMAFAALINRTCGKSTWELNPYVFAYTFELVK